MDTLKLKKQTLNIQVYETLKNMLINKEFDSENKLNEVQVANMLGVSPTPVREAFRMLAIDGLVEIIPWKGVFVKKVTLKDLEEVYQCRIALETQAINLCIDYINDEDIDKLINFLENHEDNSKSKLNLSNEIHNIIAEQSHNKRLEALIKQLNDVVFVDRNLTLKDSERSREIDKEHKEILYYIKKRDKENAAKAMALHLNNGFNYLKNNYEWDK